MIAFVDNLFCVASRKDAVNSSQVVHFVNLLDFHAFIHEHRLFPIDVNYEKVGTGTCR